MVTGWYFGCFLSRASLRAECFSKMPISDRAPLAKSILFDMWHVTPICEELLFHLWAAEDGRAGRFRSPEGERDWESESVFWEPRQLLYGGFDQPSGWIEPEMLVCVCADRESVFEEMSRWWAGVCPPPTTTQCIHLHLGLFKPYVCVDFILHLWSRQVVWGAVCMLWEAPEKEMGLSERSLEGDSL